MESEAAARQQLAECSKQLDKYQAIYGEMSTAIPPDVHNLSERLRLKEDEIVKLRLAESQRAQVRIQATDN